MKHARVEAQCSLVSTTLKSTVCNPAGYQLLREVCASTQRGWHMCAEYFQDLRAQMFSDFDLTRLEALLLGCLSFAAPFMAYFALISFVTATLVQSYRQKNHARIVWHLTHRPPSLAHAVWVRTRSSMSACCCHLNAVIL